MATLYALPQLAVIILAAAVAAPLETGGIHLAPRAGTPVTPQSGAATSPAKAPQAAASGAQAPGGGGTVGTTTVVSRAYGVVTLGGRASGAP
jgi:hypothetical protein